MKKIPPIDILIVAHNARLKAARCVASILRCTQGIDYQLSLVDNASSDGTADHLERKFSSKIQLVRSAVNLGFSGGANLLLRQTARPWVVLLDDDVEVTPGWLEKLYELACKHSKTGIVGGKVVSPRKRIFCAEFSLIPFGSVGRGEKDRGQRDYIKEVDALPGPCWLMPREVLQRVGPFDEAFFPSQCEDIDYSLRVREAGYKIFYHGGARLIHHHLFRCGSEDLQQVNYMLFFKKWGKRLGRFPMAPQNTLDRQITEGARLFVKEDFCPEYPVWGRVANLSPWFSEPFYRGVYWTEKNAGRAASALQTALKRAQDARQRRSGQEVLFYQIVAAYYARIGRMKDAERLAKKAMILGFKRGIRSLANAQKLIRKKMRFHRWSINLNADQVSFFQTLRNFLPCYPMQKNERTGSNLSILEINAVQSQRAQGGLAFLGKQSVVCDAANYGIYRTLEPQENRIDVYSNAKNRKKENLVFHGEFLGPLSYLLRSHNASLLHGALLKKNKRGLLVMGTTGAGKSTISAMCLQAGFSFLSDEHPLVELTGRKVKGKSFVSRIALPALSAARNFPGLKGQMTWCSKRRKYLLDPLKAWPGCLAASADIHAVVFPKFRADAKLSVIALENNIFFGKLLEDEYLRTVLQNELDCLEKSTPRRVAAALTRTARGYAVEYAAEHIGQLPRLFEDLLRR